MNIITVALFILFIIATIIVYYTCGMYCMWIFLMFIFFSLFTFLKKMKTNYFG